MAKRPYYVAIAAIAQPTRVAIDDSLAHLVRLGAKHAVGQTFSAAEDEQYLQAHAFLRAFSGEVVVQAMMAFIETPRGQRIMAAALPPAIVVQNHVTTPVDVHEHHHTHQARGLVNKLAERDADGLLTNIREEWIEPPATGAATAA